MSKEQLKPSNKFYNSWAFEGDRVKNFAYWESLFSPEECQQIIDYANLFQKDVGSVGSVAELNSQVRDSNIVWISPAPDIVWVYQKLTDAILSLNESYFGFDLFGIAESLQFSEYNAPSGFYGKHTDSMSDYVIRKLSVSLQLSNPKDYKGGELKLHGTDTPDIMKKEQGTLICFPSWTLHEVSPVSEGKRCALVGWVTGRPFK